MFKSVRKYFTDKNQDLSLLRLFKPVYVFLRIFGLFPYSVNFKTKPNVIVPRSIYLSILCAMFVITLMTIMMGIDIYEKVMEIFSSERATVAQVNYILESVLLQTSCVSSYICIYYNRLKLVHILNDMTTTWLQLPSTHNRILGNLRSKIVVIIITPLLMTCTQIIINCMWDNEWSWTVIPISYTCLDAIQLIALMFYYLLVLMLVALLSNVEEAIKAIHKMASVTENLRKFDGMFAPALPVRSIELSCVKAFEIKREINGAFQATILLNCVQSFHSIVSGAHGIYYGLMVSTVSETDVIVNIAIWLVFTLMKIYVFASSGSLLNVTTCRIGQALHNIPLEKQDIRIVLEIQHFSSLISFQATDMTVYGYFSLDASLFFKVIASATMYLIILVQFEKK